MTQELDDLNVSRALPLPSPNALCRALPLTDSAGAVVESARASIADIISGSSERMLIVAGPCSIHDLDAARDYLNRLAALSQRHNDQLLIAMRVYFEKPRTTVGWKGLINDPHLDDSFDLEQGLTLARQLLLELAEAGMPAATEALDPIVPQYLGDLISWYAIGARTTESQTHREMASGLSAPCGFKNGTDGSVSVAVQAMQSAASPHAFLGIDHDGRTAVIKTRGNDQAHVILRGGSSPNYDICSIGNCRDELVAQGLNPVIMVDCNHGNSGKKPERQPQIARDVIAQRLAGNKHIIGLMLESHLNFGNQPLSPGGKDLKYGVSITDACMDWDMTATLIDDLAEQLRRQSNAA